MEGKRKTCHQTAQKMENQWNRVLFRLFSYLICVSFEALRHSNWVFFCVCVQKLWEFFCEKNQNWNINFFHRYFRSVRKVTKQTNNQTKTRVHRHPHIQRANNIINTEISINSNIGLTQNWNDNSVRATILEKEKCLNKMMKKC